jgi:hypothetical protein
MTQTKTVGFSLKAFSAKLRRFLLSYRIAGIGLLLAVLSLNSLLMPGCVVKVRPGDVYQDHTLKEYEFENVRFEPLDLSNNPLPIQPARAYWLKRGEKVAVKLDTFEIHFEHVGAMCGFSDNTSAGDCQICDLCNRPPSLEGLPCFGVDFIAGVWFDIIADLGFIQTDNPKTIVEMTPRRILGACNAAPEPVPIFEPEASGLYRTAPKILPSIIKGETNGEIKLHVVEAGLTQQTAYQLMRQTVDGANYWTWTIDGASLWLENFSPNLRVTDIRIFRGICGDGSAQGKECAIPDQMAQIKPSRILFLQNFPDWGTVSQHPDQSTNSCYSNPNASGGSYINLDSCRNDAGQTTQKRATPAYIPSMADKKLTWLAEFDTSRGADLVRPDDPLIVEFTIAAN